MSLHFYFQIASCPLVFFLGGDGLLLLNFNLSMANTSNTLVNCISSRIHTYFANAFEVFSVYLTITINNKSILIYLYECSLFKKLIIKF